MHCPLRCDCRLGSVCRHLAVPWRPLPAAWTVGNKRLCPVCVAGRALEQCLPELRVLGVPSPRRCGVTQVPHRSEFTSVIYGFVLLLGTPALVCVLPTPGCFSGPTPMLSTPLETPQRLCSSRRLLTCCLQPGNSSELSGPADGRSPPCHHSLRRGTRGGWHSPSWRALPSLAWQGPWSPCPSSLSSLSLSPQISWRIDCHTGSSCLGEVEGGGTPAAHLCVEPGRAGRQASRGRPFQGSVCPCPAAGLLS